MNRRSKSLGIGLMLFSPCLINAEYQLEMSAFGNGGGESRGGPYTLNGTIGQNVGESASGGSYTLLSGFWSAVTIVRTTGAPLLFVEPTGTDIRISWPVTSTPFVLQKTTSLTGTPNIIWTTEEPVYRTNDNRISVLLPHFPGNRFFRLFHP